MVSAPHQNTSPPPATLHPKVHNSIVVSAIIALLVLYLFLLPLSLSLSLCIFIPSPKLHAHIPQTSSSSLNTFVVSFALSACLSRSIWLISLIVPILTLAILPPSCLRLHDSTAPRQAFGETRIDSTAHIPFALGHYWCGKIIISQHEE